jgi:hypothetical protein
MNTSTNINHLHVSAPECLPQGIFQIKTIKNPTHKYITYIKIQQDATVYQNFISNLYETQHVSGDTPPIIRSLKLH